MRAVIVDDEIQSHQVLSNLLYENHPEVEVLGSGTCVSEGIELINKFHPDLLFLDIEMPDGTGFDLLQKLGKYDFHLIFITAYNQYALTAIKFGALDYILKPITKEELGKAIEKVHSRHLEAFSQEQMQILWDTLRNYEKQKLPTRIAISTSEGIYYKLVQDIIRLDALQNYTEFSLNNSDKKLLASVNIGEFVEQFEPYTQFMKVHRSHLINLEYVEKFVKAEGGYIVMKDGTNVNVSRPYRDELLKRLEQI